MVDGKNEEKVEEALRIFKRTIEQMDLEGWVKRMVVKSREERVVNVDVEVDGRYARLAANIIGRAVFNALIYTGVHIKPEIKAVKGG